MKYEIGRTILVTASVPYIESDKPAIFFELTITNKREDVPGEYDHKKLYTGYLAVDSQGKEYGWGWDRWPDGSMSSPCWARQISNETFKVMTEIAKEEALAWSVYMVRDVTEFVTPKAPDFMEQYPYIKFCEAHQRLYYEWDGCFLCEHNVPPKEENQRLSLPTIKRPYNGWINY